MERYFFKFSYDNHESQIKFTYFVQILPLALLLANIFSFNNEMLGTCHTLLPLMLGTVLLFSKWSTLLRLTLKLYTLKSYDF